jgi:hypothetical protein
MPDSAITYLKTFVPYVEKVNFDRVSAEPFGDFWGQLGERFKVSVIALAGSP